MWTLDDTGESNGCHGHRYHPVAVVAMAAEEGVITPSSAHHSLNDVVEKSKEDDNDLQETPQTQIIEQDDSNVLVHEDSDIADSLPEPGSHELVGMTTHTKTRYSSSNDHIPTPCQSTNYLRSVIMQATKSSQPMCTSVPEIEIVDPGLQPVEPGLEWLKSGLDLVDVQSNASNTTNTTDDNGLHKGDNDTVKEDDDSSKAEHGELGMEEEEGTKEETGQDEDILTFEEFKQRRMLEVQQHQQEEMKNTVSELPNGHGSQRRDIVSNNYASIECGAKVILTNKEANNPRAILHENRDDYMLSPCSADIWFIVELCDTVLVHSIEIATFELFSSVPEAFAVYTSSRYPAIEWSLIGELKARDVRTVQSFPLDESVYAKYIKVELVSHFGSEHYCPLSLLRVLGTSFIQEYEDAEDELAPPTEASGVILDGTENAPDVTEEQTDASNRTSLLGAAKDVVFNLLERVSNGLMGTAGSSSKDDSSHTTAAAATPTSVNNPTTSPAGDATTSHSEPTTLLLLPPSGNHIASTTEVENSTVNGDPITSTQESYSNNNTETIITSTSSGDTLVSVVMTSQSPTTTPLPTTDNTNSDDDNNTTIFSVLETSDDISETVSVSPTATTNDINNKPVEQVDGDRSNITGVVSDTSTSGSGDQITTSTNSSATPTPLNHTSNGSNVTSDEYFDGLSVDDDTLPTQQPPVAASGQQKSSVLIRLSNRIKELEVNMSLFGDYLEQFRTSLKRNKNRTDDLQRSIERRLELLNETVTALKNETELGWLLLLQLHEDIQVLTKATLDISQSLKLQQGGWWWWSHLISEAILLIIVVAGYHTFYRSQLEAHLAAVVTKTLQEMDKLPRRNSHYGNHGVGVQNQQQQNKDSIDVVQRKKKPCKLKQPYQ
ncbi:SUN domain-containing ossification factor-like isoform X2 [Dysidea avara]